MYPGNQKREQKGPKRTKKKTQRYQKGQKKTKRDHTKRDQKETKGDKKGVLHCYKITGKVISDNLDAFF